ncbi:MAG TPA: ABC transporter ATP-binding protein [Vicinamibacterales bacterium]|jgi:cobalt/nickel transport system ATP-binding protein
MNVFDVADVTYRYQRQVALDALSMSVVEGTRVGLVGSNGSGKSTLLRLLDGLYFPETGEVRFCGEPLTEARFGDDDLAFAFRRRVGLVFQNPDAQLFNPTVFDEVAFGPLQLRWPPGEVRTRVAEAMERMRIADLKNRTPQRLSGGEKKRVAIASVLAMDPDVLLLDEPTAALDPRSQSQIIDLLVGWAGTGKTVITATHDLGILEDIADRCCVLDRGRLVADRSPAALLADEDLLGRTNLIHAHRHHHGAAHEHSHPHVHRR